MGTAYFSEVAAFFDYQLKNTDLLYQAFSGGTDEVLPAIGKQVLPVYVLKNVLDHYGTYEDRDEENYGAGAFSLRGGMNPDKINALTEKLLSDDYLSGCIRKAKLDKFQSEEPREDAELFRALIGAVALDSRFNPGVLQNAVRKALAVESFLEELPPEPEKTVKVTLETAVNRLKELGDKGKCSAPMYEFDDPETIGEDVNGTPVWYCKCTVESLNLMKGAFAASKKNAKKCASYLVLCEYYGQENEYGIDPELIEYQVTMP